MIQQEFSTEWGVWCLFEAEKASNQEVNYDKNLEQVYRIKNLNELAYLWSKSSISNLDNFLSNPKTGTVKKYAGKDPVDAPRKIESVCFFRSGISPTWQDAKNKIGGQFCCFLNRDQLDASPVYQSFVFCLLGDLLPEAAYINGIRFVDKYNEKRGESIIKMEIWVRFKEAEKTLIESFSKGLTGFAASINLAISKLEFKNI